MSKVMDIEEIIFYFRNRENEGKVCKSEWE
jgi:hypothetical protein